MKKQRILSLLIVMVLCCSFVFTGCSSDSAGEDETETAVQETTSKEAVKSDKILTIGTPQSSASLDPTNGYDYWYLVRYGVCETLMGFNEDMTPYGWLLEDDYELSEDQLTWTFKLREGITFSSGKELTAEDVKACLERTLKDTTIASTYLQCESINADGLTLEITTKELTPTLPYLLADPVFVIYDTSEDLTNAADNGVVGTGPFVVKSFDVTTGDTSVVRNENYWNGDVKLGGIDFKIIKDTATLNLSLQTGEIDAAYSLDTADVGNYENSDDFYLETSPSGRTTFSFMNQNGVLKDQNLRQAIMMACDRETYCSSLLQDMFVPGKTPLTSSLPYGYDELNDVNAYDPEGAAKILDEAGYVDTDGDGYREQPDGKPLTITLTNYNARAEIPLLSQAMQSDCQAIGIHIELNTVDQESAWNMLTTGEYDMVMMSISLASSGDPETGLRSYFMSYDEENPNYNLSGYSNEEVDTLLKDLSVEFDTDKRIEIVKEIEQILMDDSACFYLCYPIMNFGVRADVTGVTSHTSDYYWVSADTGFTE
ncbi:MAG: ABC transporter substrate-binding protein [Lachnospiraceae bacterium]|nr:ABC transporter substrate-binding protein [Lachnospiraceae bacterium]